MGSIKNIKTMNRQEFIDALNKIGWSVKLSHNGLNDKLVTPNGTITDMRLREDCLEPYSNNLYGGESFIASAKWYLKDARYEEKEGYIAINHLLLINHNINKNE